MTDYEAEARARKVDAIVEQLDAALARIGFDDPRADAVHVIPVLRSTDILSDCAKALNKGSPSDKTRAAVIAVYEQRAKDSRTLKATPLGSEKTALSRAVEIRDATPLSRITASKLDLAMHCLHWATRDDLPPDVSGERAVRGTAFHDLVATGEIAPETLRDLKPEYEPEVRKMYAVWLKNGQKLLPPDARHEVAFVLEPTGNVRELGQNIARGYGGAVGLCGTVDVFGNDVVRDFKTGRKYHDADVAWQLRFAAVVTGCHKTAFDYIAASGRTTPDEYTRSDAQIADDKRRLLVLMSDVREGRTAPLAGSHCEEGYCLARTVCPTYKRAYHAPAKDSHSKQQPTETTMGKMTLASVKKGRVDTPLCVVMYGPEGIGKSTFAANAPNPIFIDAEDGSTRLDVSRFPVPENWEHVRESLALLANEKHEYQSVAIDTADWIEPLIYEHVCTAGSKSSIEDFGYGKGYVQALDQWRAFLDQLDLLRARGMHVILLAHTQVKTFRNPAGDDYDRYELKLHAKAAGLLKEWSDAVLFTNYLAFPKETDGKKVKMLGDGSRVIYTEHRPAWDAKNKYGLPFKLPLDWTEFERAARKGEPASFEEVSAEILQLLSAADEKTKEQAAPAIERCGKDTRKLAALADWLRSKANKEAA